MGSMRIHEAIGSTASSVPTALNAWNARNASNVTIEGADASPVAQLFILTEN